MLHFDLPDTNALKNMRTLVITESTPSGEELDQITISGVSLEIEDVLQRCVGTMFLASECIAAGDNALAAYLFNVVAGAFTNTLADLIGVLLTSEQIDKVHLLVDDVNESPPFWSAAHGRFQRIVGPDDGQEPN